MNTSFQNILNETAKCIFTWRNNHKRPLICAMTSYVSLRMRLIAFTYLSKGARFRTYCAIVFLWISFILYSSACGVLTLSIRGGGKGKLTGQKWNPVHILRVINTTSRIFTNWKRDARTGTEVFSRQNAAAHLKCNQGPVSVKSRELLRARKAGCQTSICSFWAADLLTCFYSKKNQGDCFDDLEPRRCENIKGILAPKKDQKSCGTFEKRTTVAKNNPTVSSQNARPLPLIISRQILMHALSPL